MPAPIGTITFGELVVAVARQRGSARQVKDKFEPPTGIELARCHEIVRKGWLRVCVEYPQWRWMRQKMEVVLVAAQREYEMPWFFDGRVRGGLTYSSDGPRLRVDIVTEGEYLELTGDSSTPTGDPTRVAFYRRAPGSGDGLSRAERGERWIMGCFPTPNTVRTLRCIVDAQPGGLFESKDRHFAGPTYNLLVERACLAEAEFDAKRMAGPLKDEYLDMLQAAIALDKESGPRIVGQLPTDDEEDDRPPWTDPILSVEYTNLP